MPAKGFTQAPRRAPRTPEYVRAELLLLNWGVPERKLRPTSVAELADFIRDAAAYRTVVARERGHR